MSQRVPQEFIKNLQGKEFVLLGGLLELAHQDGLSSTKTEVIQLPTKENEYIAVMLVTATTSKGVFQGLGDASPKSTSSQIAPHLIRMAETRGLARALRVATNVSMTAFEEIMSVADEPPPPATDQQKSSIQDICKSLSLIGNEFKKWLTDRKINWAKMTAEQATKITTELKAMKKTADDAVTEAAMVK